MKNQTIASCLILSLAAVTPGAARADLKDVIAGGVLGAIITQSVNNNKNKQSSGKPAQQKVAKPKYTKPSLNSQYSRAERMQIQTALQNRGYPVGTIDGVLGRNSRSAISQFQTSIGQPGTGQLTPTQFAALTGAGAASMPVVADRALTRDEVVLLQQSLKTLGYYGGGIDGASGPGTRGATAAFLTNQGLNPAQITQVQAVVQATAMAGLATPPYLQQEAQMQMAAANGGGFGAPAPQQNGFGAQQPVTAGFGAQPQQQNLFGGAQPQTAGFGGQAVQQPQQNGFGAQQPQQQPLFGNAPVQNAGVGAQPQQQNLFGGAQPQQVPQQAGTDLFGGQQQPLAPQGNGVQQPAQQPLFAPAPQGQQPAQQGGGTLFASGTPAAPAPAAQPQSSLDVFSIQQPQAGTQIAGQQPVQQPTTVAGGVFGQPTATASFAPTAPQVAPQASGTLDIFGASSN